MAKTKQSKKKTKTETKTKIKAKSKTKRRRSSTWSAADRLLTRRILMTVRDEIFDLVAVLSCLPLLRQMADVMHDIQHSPSTPERPSSYGSNDRIGRDALENYGVSLDEQLSQPGMELVEHTSDLTTDMHDAIDEIIEAVRWRLYRLEALIKLMKDEMPKSSSERMETFWKD